MYFPVKEVRFIAIADEFDTAHNIYATDDKGNLIKDFRVKSMLDEAVTHDISKKVSTNLNELAKQGLFIAPRAPYGYKKINKHKLGIDPMAAIVVKKIFKLASENVGITEIARTLSEEKVLTPMEYATSNGTKGNYNTGNGKWSTRTIKDILTNITYAGHLCQGKEKITILNTHDAVIAQDLFDEVQIIINPTKTVQSVSASSKESPGNPLRGKVICGCCGGKMQRRKGTGNADWYFFTCITNNRQGKGSCDGMYIRESAIYDKIIKDITEFITNNADTIKCMSTQKQELRKTMYDLHQKDIEVNSFKRSCYEKVCLGEMSAEEYRKTVDAQTDNTDTIAEIECKIAEMDKLREKYNFYVKVRENRIITEEFVKVYVEKLLISDKSLLVEYKL